MVSLRDATALREFRKDKAVAKELVMTNVLYPDFVDSEIGFGTSFELNSRDAEIDFGLKFNEKAE